LFEGVELRPQPSDKLQHQAIFQQLKSGLERRFFKTAVCYTHLPWGILTDCYPLEAHILRTNGQQGKEPYLRLFCVFEAR
jgi:hypothetical protein